MMPPLILCLFMGTLALACVGTVVWQVGLLLAGAAWADVSFPLIMGQLGALFFGLFSLASWGQHKGEDVGAGIIHGLLLSLVLELTLLLGWSALHMFDESYTLVTQGVEVQGRIVDYERRSAHSHRPIFLVYEFLTREGESLRSTNAGAALRRERWSWFWEWKEEDRIGAQVPVLYLPSNPTLNNINRTGALWGMPRAWGCSVSFLPVSACSSSRVCWAASAVANLVTGHASPGETCRGVDAIPTRWNN